MLFAHILKLGISENKRQNYAFHHFIPKNFGGFKIKSYICGRNAMLRLCPIKLLMVWQDI